MHNSQRKTANGISSVSRPEPGTGKRLLRLLACILLVLAFIFIVGPWITRLSFVKPLATFIDERNIDAGALFYTEVEQFSDVDVHMRNTMNYSP
ncbi:MAG: hypothetical protein ACYS8W_09165 [Planctomycetota bacterium]|jgi:hypothetical protein